VSQKRSHYFFYLLIVTLLVTYAVLILSLRSKKASVGIIGKWQVEAGNDTCEFRKDGQFINVHDVVVGAPGNTNVFKQETVGKYTFTGGNPMNILIDLNGSYIRLEVHIHGDRMDGTMIVGDSEQHAKQYKVNLRRLKQQN
jgi:hypothetical protein